MTLPACETLKVALDAAGVVQVTLHRPEVKNAMSLRMVQELESIVDAVADDRGVRVIVLRGAEGTFCAGGDVKDMAQARMAPVVADQPDPVAVVSRTFGRMITKFDAAPQAVVAVLEGSVLGGGMGLACVADVAIARADATFGLPETGLGIPPAQIAPFLVRRLGLSQARRLAVTGGRFDGRSALEIGLVHAVAEDAAGVDAELSRTLASILRCAPGAIAVTKRIMLDVGRVDHESLLDDAAQAFAVAARGLEGSEGTMAFLQKRKPKWTPGEGA